MYCLSSDKIYNVYSKKCVSKKSHEGLQYMRKYNYCIKNLQSPKCNTIRKHIRDKKYIRYMITLFIVVFSIYLFKPTINNYIEKNVANYVNKKIKKDIGIDTSDLKKFVSHNKSHFKTIITTSNSINDAIDVVSIYYKTIINKFIPRGIPATSISPDDKKRRSKQEDNYVIMPGGFPITSNKKSSSNQTFYSAKSNSD